MIITLVIKKYNIIIKAQLKTYPEKNHLIRSNQLEHFNDNPDYLFDSNFILLSHLVHYQQHTLVKNQNNFVKFRWKER